MTQRLYYTDSYLTTFEAEIVGVRPISTHYHVYLDRTAFYPTSGGQPYDLGWIEGRQLVDVVDEGDQIAHVIAVELRPVKVTCKIDWTRRFDHMQQHTGQHLLSAVLEELFGFPTVSFHLGSEASTIDIACAELTPAQVETAEARANALVFENRNVTARFYDAEQAASIGLRKPTDREGTVRVIEIAGCDRSACGGTHVRATGEIGPILIRKLDRVRQTVRVEFVCGGRAIRRARADYTALARVAQLFSASLDQAPDLAAAQIEAAKAADKARQKAEAELAVLKGRELYRATPPDERGMQLHRASERAGPIDPWRLLSQNFTAAGPNAAFMLTIDQPPTLLVALSPDWNLNAGQIVKGVVGPLGGRGGGNAALAQASLPNDTLVTEAARRVLEVIKDAAATRRHSEE